MPMLKIATLNAISLPEHFSYRPYMPRKRTSVVATAGAVVTQASSPVIVHGDGTLAWTIKSAFASEFQAVYNQFNTASNDLLTFEGYWGETLEVYFNVMDDPQVRGRLFDLSGQFQVVAVTVQYNAACGIVQSIG